MRRRDLIAGAVRAAGFLVGLALMLGLTSSASGQGGPLVFIGNGAVPYDITEGGGATTVSIPVTLSQPSDTQVTVDWHTESAWFPHTATAGSDYQAASGTVVFAPHQTSQTVNVTVYDDGIAEEDESFVVALENPVGAQIGIPNDFWTHGAVVTIHDNEVGAFIGEGGYTLYAAEGDSGTTPFPISLRLNFASATPVSVSWETRDDPFAQNPATPGQDYEAASGTVTFAPGETSKTIDVGIIGDTLHEPGEQFSVAITDVVGAQKGVPWDGWVLGANVEISDDDPEPPPPGPCILLSTTSVNVTGTASTPSMARAASSQHFTVHNCGDSAVHLAARGTDATGAAGSWQLTRQASTGGAGSVCDLGANVFRAGVTLWLGSPAEPALTAISTDDTFLAGADGNNPFTLDGAADQGLSADIEFPCVGSVGLGEPMSMDMTLTAVSP